MYARCMQPLTHDEACCYHHLSQQLATHCKPVLLDPEVWQLSQMAVASSSKYFSCIMRALAVLIALRITPMDTVA